MRAGSVIGGRFEIIERAAVGGMSAVYRAVNRATGEAVALKVLRDPSAEPERFVHEAQVLAEIQHPHVVRYVTHGLGPGGEPYLVMEWLQGRSLQEQLDGVPLGIEESVTLARRVAEALEAAHARGVVHRDLKPSNLLLVGGTVEQVKVLDFGIARWMEATRPLTRTGMVLGTPGYMAPEQARGERDVGPQADVFSLGCVLFECLTGRPAFRGAHLMALLAKLLLEAPPPVRDLRPEVPEALSALIERMLAKDPALRPQDGAAVVAALDGLAVSGGSAGGSWHAPPPSGLTGTEKRLVSVVAARVPVPVAAFNTAETWPVAGPRPAVLDAMRRAAEPLGAQVEPLADGTVLAVLVGAGSATDQAARAARCALISRLALPEGPIALVTGRGEATERVPFGETLDRVVDLLAQSSPGGMGASVAIDPVTRALLDTRFVVEEEPGQLWLHSERAIGEEPRTLLGKPSPLLGRDRELARLCDLVEEGFEVPRSTAILVTAAAGMGKSRLRQELVRALRERHPKAITVLGRGDPIGAGSPFAMVGSAFRVGMGIEAGEPASAQRQKLAFFVRRHISGEQARHAREMLGELLGTPFPDEDSPRLRAARQDAAIMADQIEAAYVEVTRAATRKHPVLLVLEDLHWGDAPSVKLLEVALRELGDAPFVVVAFARPEVHERFPRLWEQRLGQEVRLGGLARRAAEQLARTALGDAVDTAQITAIVERAGGNAFYLEEFIRALAEGRGDALPETVLGMVEARLVALDPEARRLLRAASIFGETFWKRGVLALLGEAWGAHGARDLFAELTERELIVRRDERRFAGEEEYAFRHALIREASYSMLTDSDRALGHRLAAEWLESAGEPDATVLAAHFAAGGEGARAAIHHAKAAERALRGNDPAAVLAATEQGLAAGAEGAATAALWSLRAMAALWSGQRVLAVDAAEEALRLGAPGSKHGCRALGAAIAAALLLRREEALPRLLERLLAVEPEPEAAPALAWAFVTAVNVLVYAGQRDAAALYLDRLRAVCGPRAAREPGVSACIEQLTGLWESYVTWDRWAALRAHDAATARFEQLGARHHGVSAAAIALFDLLHLGQPAEAERRLRLLERSVLRGSMLGLTVQLARAQIRVVEGALDEAAGILREAIEDSARQQDEFLGPIARVVLVEVLVRRGDLDEAEAALPVARAATAAMHVNDQWARAVTAELRLRQGRAAEALSEAEEALARVRASGVVGLNHAALLSAHAEALHATGEIERARDAIRDARDAILARAARIGDPAYRQTFLENVRANARILALAREWLGEDAPVPVP